MDVSGGSKGVTVGDVVFLRFRNKTSATATIATTAPPMTPPTIAGVLDLREDVNAEGVPDCEEEPDDMVDVGVTAKLGEATKPGLRRKMGMCKTMIER